MGNEFILFHLFYFSYTISSHCNGIFSMARMERTVYTLLRTRESLMRNCKEFQIPTVWMLDDGIISKVNLISYIVLLFKLSTDARLYELGIINGVIISSVKF